MSGHTPGPWRINDAARSPPPKVKVWSPSAAESAGGEFEMGWVAELSRKRPQSEREANARLIAAAPELLDALRDLVGAIAEMKLEMAGHVSLEEARAAIAKAEGGR